ncbi:MAG: endonuclease/exonuclease/phosphatase family protein [Myxococcales bacterium]|nr:endonuclease/exonuclease/phosphatase family protein [Myxococcales bacterium]
MTAGCLPPESSDHPAPREAPALPDLPDDVEQQAPPEEPPVEPLPDPDPPVEQPPVDPPVEIDPVVVATFNVKRFFDTVCDSGRCTADDYEHVYAESEFEAKADLVAYGIERLDADVVLLQEVESVACLDALKSRLADRYPVAVLGELGYAASLDVAVLGRDRILATRRHADHRIPLMNGGTTTFSREVLEVHLEVDGRRVIAIAAHFKAKNNDDPERRLAEGMAARQIILDAAAAHPEALVVFGGDLNDTPGSPPIDALEGDGDLLRVASELGDDAATYIWGDDAQAIDHIYLAQPASGDYVSGTAEVVRDGRGLARSDHAGLRATFALPPLD